MLFNFLATNSRYCRLGLVLWFFILNLFCRYEAQFIQDIVKEVGKKLNRMILHVPPYLVGIESRVKEIRSWLQDGSDKVGIAILHGFGGVGKTTIAKTVFNQNFHEFDSWSFL